MDVGIQRDQGKVGVDDEGGRPSLTSFDLTLRLEADIVVICATRSSRCAVVRAMVETVDRRDARFRSSRSPAARAIASSCR